MIKNIALFLASTSLACVIPASSVIVPKSGDNVALTSERSINPDFYDGYNFFGDCIVESTIVWDIVDPSVGDIYFEDVSRVSFGEWLPSRVNTVFNTDRNVAFTGGGSAYYYDNYMSIETLSRGANDDIYLYNRTFDCTAEFVTDDDIYGANVYQWRVLQDTPIIVPYVFLEQFLLGLKPDENITDEFYGDIWVYNFTAHTFDHRSLRLLSYADVRQDDFIDPSSLSSIFETGDNRYIYYDDDDSYISNPLLYNGGWVFCRFDLLWVTYAIEDTSFYYTNEYASEEVGNLLRSVSPAQLKADTYNVWSKVFGDTIYLEPINPPSLIFDTVEGFLDTEFMPEFSFGDLLLIVLGAMVFGAFLKVFLGG